MKNYGYKNVKYTPARHQVIDELRQEIEHERGTKESLASVCIEAVHFFKKYRNHARYRQD